jgi:hypothetical protein
MARAELHIQLYVRYMDDAKLESVSRSARLLYVDATCKARELLSDGFVSDVQLVKLAHPETPGKARKLAGELVASGAWEKHEGGYVIGAFLKRNPSKSDVMAAADEASEAGIRGNHERWHKGRISSTCPLCPSTEPPGDDEFSEKTFTTESQRAVVENSTLIRTETDSAAPTSSPSAITAGSERGAHRVIVGVPDTYPIGCESGSDPISSPETETETETLKESPTPTTSVGASCSTEHHGQHPRCRHCGTNPRKRGTNPRALHALADLPPRYCGQCHETYPVRKGADGRYLECPTCHPEANTA